MADVKGSKGLTIVAARGSKCWSLGLGIERWRVDPGKLQFVAAAQFNTSAQKIGGLSYLWTEAWLTRVKNPAFRAKQRSRSCQTARGGDVVAVQNTTATWPVTSSWLAECPEQRHLPPSSSCQLPNIVTTRAPMSSVPSSCKGDQIITDCTAARSMERRHLYLKPVLEAALFIGSEEHGGRYSTSRARLIYDKSGHLDWHRDLIHGKNHHVTVLVAVDTSCSGGGVYLRHDG